MDSNQDRIVRLYSRLTSLKQNLPVGANIAAQYINEYHSILLELQKITSDLSEFFVPEGDISPVVTSFNYRTGKKFYSEKLFCERSFLLIKLDGLLGYFQIKYLSEEKPTIGFNRG